MSSTRRIYHPVNPDCPKVEAFHRMMDEDPMNDHIPGDVLSDVRRDFEAAHRKECVHCFLFGLANVTVTFE